MGNLSALVGGGAGAPIGAIVAGHLANNADYIPLDGRVRLKATYPDLDASKMLSFDGQSVVTGPTVTAKDYRVMWITGTTWYAYSLTDTVAFQSTDNGATWASRTMPTTGAQADIQYANGLYFCCPMDAVLTSNYWTSTDGISWTARTFPVSVHSFACIGYIDGRYIALPTGTQNGSVGMSLWSTNGITWTAVTLPGSQISPTYNRRQRIRTFPWSPATGILLGAYQSGPSYWTACSRDGLSWTYISGPSGLNGAGAVPYGGPSDIGATQDLTGSLVSGSYVYAGTSNGSVLQIESSISVSPFPISNVCANGPNLSEDEGRTFHRSLSPWAGARNACDFSGSRLLSIDNSGVVRWIDVSSTSFRTPTPRRTMFGTKNWEQLYMKVR